jgi:hypothetical protein
MKKYFLPVSWLYRFLTIALISLLILIPQLSLHTASYARAQGNNSTFDNSTSGSSTPELPAISDNFTLHLSPPSDNATIGIPFPESTAKVVNPDEEAQLLSPKGKIKLKIPKGIISKSTQFELKEHVNLSSTGMKMVNLFELNATQVDSKEKVKKFNKELEITIQHTPEELAGLDLDSLYLYYLDEETRQWVPVPSTFDRDTLILTATIDHFTHFGEQANPLQNGPGRVMAADVDLHSGAATYSYQLELPPGPGGFQPSLALTYDSGSVDGMKNKRDVGSWVGIGWNLNLGSINYDASSQTYYLNMNGISYKLFTTDGTNFHTTPEEYLKITKSGNTWTVYDKEGTYYRFGGTTDSQQYYDTSNYYRWDLSYWKDTNGDEATVSYVRDIWNNSVRSAYPEYLRYNNNLVEVHFISSYYENGTYGPVRKDNPINLRQ